MTPTRRTAAGGGARSRPSPGGPARPERGMVTAELALVLPAVVLLLVVLLTAATAALTQVRVADAARSGARVAALGEPVPVVAELARGLAGSAARVRVGTDGGYVVVDVERDLPGLLGLADLRASATARALPEPGVDR